MKKIPLSALYILILFSNAGFIYFAPPTMEDFRQMRKDFLDPTPSHVNRKEIHNQYGLRAFGPRYADIFESAFVFGHYLNADEVLEFDLGWNEESFSTPNSIQYSSTFAFGVGYKYFLGNSIYSRVASRYRELNTNKSRDLDFGYHFKGHRGEAIAAIGSQWQWKQMAFGIETGMILPVFGNFSEEGLLKTISDSEFTSRKAQFASHPEYFIQIYIGLISTHREKWRKDD